MTDPMSERLSAEEREDFQRQLRQNLGHRAFVIEDTLADHVDRILAARAQAAPAPVVREGCCEDDCDQCLRATPYPDDPDAWIGHPANLPATAKPSCLAGGCEVGDRVGCCSPTAPEGGLREAIEALIENWSGVYERVYASRELADLLAAHPAPAETREVKSDAFAAGEVAGAMKHITAEMVRGDQPLEAKEELIADLRARLSHVEAERDDLARRIGGGSDGE